MSLEDMAVWPRNSKGTAHSRKNSRYQASHLNNIYWQKTNQSLVYWKFEKELENQYAFWHSQQPTGWEDHTSLESALEERKAARDVYLLLSQVEELKWKADANEAEKAATEAYLDKVKLEMKYCKEDKEEAQRQNQLLRAEIRNMHESWASLTRDIINLRPTFVIDEVEDELSEEEEEEEDDQDLRLLQYENEEHQEQDLLLLQYENEEHQEQDLLLLQYEQKEQEQDSLLLQYEKELQLERELNTSLNERIIALEMHNAKLTESAVVYWLYRLWQWITGLFMESRRRFLILHRTLKEKEE